MQKFKAVKISSILGIVGNVFLLVIKMIVGIFSNSQAMMADAFNSAGDIFSSIMTFIGNKIASKPCDDDHNLGHGKAEYIYSLFISMTMFVMAFQILKSSITSLVKHDSIIFSYWLVVVCIVTIVVKFLLFIYTNHVSKKYNNLLVKANANDHRNDCILTLLNLISCILSLKGIYFIDDIVGIIISIWILFTAIDIFKESYNVLMDKSIDLETKEKVYNVIFGYKDVVNVSHFNSVPVGYQYQISFTIFVDGDLSTFESHDIANRLEKEIDKKFDEIYLTVIHVNPIKVNKDRNVKD